MEPNTLALDASLLQNRPQNIEVPEPEPVETPSQFVQRAVSPIITADTEEARRRDEVFGQIQEVGQERPDFDRQFNQQLGDLGTPDAVNQLRDVQTQLSALNTQFDVQNVQIAEGNSIGQSQREVSQNERERAVRTAGLAAQAQLLQGNIETAQSIARDVVNFAFQDEQARLNQLNAQYNALDGIVEGQEAQLLEQRRRELDAEQAELDNIRDNVQAAIASGANPNEVAQMTDSNLSGEERLNVALAAQARIASEDRNAELSARAASIRASNASAALNEQKLLDAQAKQEAINEAIASGQVILDDEQADRAAKIAKEFEDESGEFKKQVDAYNRIVASVEDPSAAGDLALIFNYMKMLDPGSVVRESEFATAQNAAGVPARVRAQWNNVLNGQKLADTQRDDFFDRAGKLYNQGLEQQVSREGRFRKQATDLFNLPEQAADLIVQDIRATGAVSEVAFGLTMGNLSDQQIADLAAEGLIPTE